MGTQQVSAPPCAPSSESGGRTPSSASGGPAPSSGVLHARVRHTTAFTVVGNHLTRHRALSLLAIGLAVHIQSLPDGARISIKHLAARFPESEARIAVALRELEATGYLCRSRVRLPDGRIVTRTVSYDRPGAEVPAATIPRPRTGERDTPVAPAAPPPAVPGPTPVVHPPVPEQPPAVPGPTPVVHPPVPELPPVPAPPAVLLPAPTARTVPPPPLPRPRASDPALHRSAAALLADLRRLSPQLTLSERDIETLAPGVVSWLERDAHPDTVRRALTSDLPVPLKHPAKLLRHRITALLPPPLPGSEDLVPPRSGRLVIPLQNCDRCDRAFRSRHPGHCRDCGTGAREAA
ncbi:helix-turn-helix domain-containing protein [Streptomyces sp. NPDC006296]|uniref:helix-turn-helix domain-containing protein n=1 Tax=Streptomyces sp. NPDC006296 TaxID=3156746 RepID=UPI0033B427C6